MHGYLAFCRQAIDFDAATPDWMSYEAGNSVARTRLSGLRPLQLYYVVTPMVLEIRISHFDHAANKQMYHDPSLSPFCAILPDDFETIPVKWTKRKNVLSINMKWEIKTNSSKSLFEFIYEYINYKLPPPRVSTRFFSGQNGSFRGQSIYSIYGGQKSISTTKYPFGGSHRKNGKISTYLNITDKIRKEREIFTIKSLKQ